MYECLHKQWFLQAEGLTRGNTLIALVGQICGVHGNSNCSLGIGLSREISYLIVFRLRHLFHYKSGSRYLSLETFMKHHEPHSGVEAQSIVAA